MIKFRLPKFKLRAFFNIHLVILKNFIRGCILNFNKGPFFGDFAIHTNEVKFVINDSSISAQMCFCMHT